MTGASRRPYREFGAWLRSRRLARRWTQEELARRLGYNVTYVRKIEWGERRASDALRIRLAQVLGVPVSSLPASVAIVRPRRLPETSSPLIGRSREVEAVVALLEGDARLVTIVGAPGIGKTRLALEVAARLDDRLAGGARFAPLLGVGDGDSITRPIGEALGVASPAGAQALERLVDALASQDSLLVLDNFEHVLTEAALVGELLGRAPGLRVLVTSREPLELRSEVQFALPPLALPAEATGPPEDVGEVAAVELFVASARKVRSDFSIGDSNAAAVAEICRRLQGIPLAIELAAGAIRLLTPQDLLAHLGSGLELPVAGFRDAPDHHRTLRAAIDWSFSLLGEDERVLLSRLAVFPGGCTIDAAATVCHFPDQPALDPRRGLLGLARKSLLEPVADASGGTRFVALEAVRALALERLAASGEVDRLRGRLADWCVALAEEQEERLTGIDQAQALAALEAEHVNLGAALTWALEHAPTVAVRLCGALWRFWLIRGHVDEGRQWSARALAASGPAAPHDAASEARATIGAGVLARVQGAYAVATALLERGGALAQSTGDQRGLALAVINLGIVASDQAEYQEAAERFEQSRALSEAVADARGVGHSVNCLGGVRLGQGDPEAAAALFEQALSIFREAEDDWSTAMVLANLGWVEHKQGRHAVARMLYEKGLETYRALGDERGVAAMLLNLGLAGDGGDVVGLFEEALLIFSRLGERRSFAECLEALAAVGLASAPRWSTLLLAASESLRQAIGAARWPEEQAAHMAVVGDLRRSLGDAAFDVAWAQGRVMPREEVVAVALTRPGLV